MGSDAGHVWMTARHGESKGEAVEVALQYLVAVGQLQSSRGECGVDAVTEGFDGQAPADLVGDLGGERMDLVAEVR